MAEKENSPEIEKPSEDDEDLTKLESRKSELAGKITQAQTDTSTLLKDIVEHSDSVATSLAKDIESLRSVDGKLETESIKSITKMGKRAKETVSRTLTYSRIYEGIVITCFAAIGLIGGYLFIQYLPSLESIFIGIWIVLGIVTGFGLFFMHRSLSDEPSSLDTDIGKSVAGVAEIAAERPLLTHDLNPLRRFAVAAAAVGKQLAGDALELIPNGDKIIVSYKEKARRRKFVDDFSFALHRYNIDMSKEMEYLITSHLTAFDELPEWLTEASRNLVEIFPGTNPEFFQLVYYEFFDSKYADKLWKENHGNVNFRKQISQLLIDNKLVEAPAGGESVPIIAELLGRLPTYSLEDTKILTVNFFHDLAAFKASCVEHLNFYGLGIKEKRELLDSRTPESADAARWKDDIIEFIATDILGMNVQVVKLLIQSAEGDQQRISTWTKILESGELDELASILSLRRIRSRFADFERNAFLGHMKLAMMENPDEFSLADIEAGVESLEVSILSTRNRVTHTMDSFRLGSLNMNFIYNHVPLERSRIESEVLQYVSTALKLDNELVTMLYYSANGLDGAQGLFQKFINSAKADMLENLLVKNGFLTKSSFVVNTVPLLKKQDSFNLSNFISIYKRYESLFESLDGFYPFLDEMGVITRNDALSLTDVLNACPISNPIPMEEQLVVLALMLVAASVGSLVLELEQRKDLALASTALFLRMHGYPGYRTLCKDIIRTKREFAAKILFQYVNLVAESTMSQAKAMLKEATIKAMSGTVDVSNYEFFRSELADGRLASSAAYLFSQFRKEIKDELGTLKSKGFETEALTNYLNSIRDLLYHQIDERVVREFLLTEMLSAYLLTVPKNRPAIGFITEKFQYLEQAQAELAEKRKDPSFENLVRVAEGSGKGTRIGLVPTNLTFEEFYVRFKDVWSKALYLHNQDPLNKKLPIPLPCYLVRIYPSSEGLKEIMTDNIIEGKPLEVVRKLIKKTVSVDDSVALLSLLQKTPSGKLALLNVIKAVIDAPSSSLLTLAKDQIEDIISKSQNVKKQFEKRELDKSLMKNYSTNRLSELGEKIAERAKMAGMDVALVEFRKRFLDVIGDTSGIAPEDVEILVKSLFTRLNIIGIPSIL